MKEKATENKTEGPETGKLVLALFRKVLEEQGVTIYVDELLSCSSLEKIHDSISRGYVVDGITTRTSYLSKGEVVVIVFLRDEYSKTPEHDIIVGHFGKNNKLFKNFYIVMIPDIETPEDIPNEAVIIA